MRKLLFNIVSQTCAWIIVSINFVSNMLLKVVGTTGYLLMKAIDAKRIAVYEKMLPAEEELEVDELALQNTELRLLASANQVRDHARETKDWTDRHTEALNAIGDALVIELGWEEEHVHQYMRSLVESIDGLEYGTEG